MTPSPLSQIGRPPSMDAPRPGAPPQTGPSTAAAIGPVPSKPDVSLAHYLGPEKRCYQCEFFKEPSTCSLGVENGTVDPEGGCQLFQMSDNDGDEGTPDAGTENLQGGPAAQSGGKF
jgi:hypothetical protein